MPAVQDTVQALIYCCRLLFQMDSMCITVTELFRSAFMSFPLSVFLLWLSHTFLFFSFSASLSTSSLLSLNLFSLFCKLGVLVRNRISLFGKEVHANAFTSAPSLLLFSVCVSAAWMFPNEEYCQNHRCAPERKYKINKISPYSLSQLVVKHMKHYL